MRPAGNQICGQFLAHLLPTWVPRPAATLYELDEQGANKRLGKLWNA